MARRTMTMTLAGGEATRKVVRGNRRVEPERLGRVRADGRAAPWAGLGVDVAGSMRADEAIRAAGLDWTVRTERIVTESGLPVESRRRLAVVREDTGTVLGVVGRQHRLIDNRTCFDFMDAVAGAGGGVTYETAGYVGDGERVWLLARTDGLITVKGRDVTQPYLLLSNTHDGSGRLQTFFTAIRVCCLNTLNMALREGRGEGIAIRHSGNVLEKVELAQHVLGLARRYFDDLAGTFGRMAEHRLSDAQRAAYFKSVFRPRADEDGRKWPAIRSKLDELAEAGAGQAELPEIRGTLWAAYNAVTEYGDYFASGRTTGLSDAERQSTRLNQIWFGSRARQKSRALDLAHALLN